MTCRIARQAGISVFGTSRLTQGMCALFADSQACGHMHRMIHPIVDPDTCACIVCMQASGWQLHWMLR